jgi:hypothetical protein
LYGGAVGGDGKPWPKIKPLYLVGMAGSPSIQFRQVLYQKRRSEATPQF